MKTILLLVISIAFTPSCRDLLRVPPAKIALNQLGYYTTEPKIAIVAGETAAQIFWVISNNKKDTIFTGKLSATMQSANSLLQTKIADFSTLTIKGAYYIGVTGMENSYTFLIDEHVLHQAAVASLKGYYYQRVSMPLEVAYAGKWHRPAGHPDTAVLIHASAATTLKPAGTKISTPGGWYDAGDYNKYIVNSGITMGTLLSAYEDFPEYFNTLNTSIPESNNRVPDLLNEIIYNLRWMLTMQDANDGGVYNKCTNAAFDGMVMPGVTKATRYVVQKGTAATLDFAAVTAQASRILKKFNKELPGLSDSCLAASEKAWQWAILNPQVVYDQDAINKIYTPAITTGGYGDKTFDDEYFWAACELFATTRNDMYKEPVLKGLDKQIRLPSWADVQTLGYYTLARCKNVLPDKNVDAVKQRIIAFADAYLSRVSSNAFQTVMGTSKSDFVWGSNAVAANQGILLINAYLFTSDKKYIHAALSNADYLLGRNATGYCFLTGVGSKPVMHPHHRPSVADGIVDPVPGLLAGGPNPGMQDRCKYEYTEAETAYNDIDCAYACNEIAINWNAPFVYLINALEALIH